MMTPSAISPTTLAVYLGAALAEIAGCYAFWAWLRLGKSVAWVAPGVVSNVNFGPGTFDPNLAMTRVGADGKVCFTNSVHGAVDVIIDAQVIGDAAAFTLPSADGSVRILDTREARP